MRFEPSDDFEPLLDRHADEVDAYLSAYAGPLVDYCHANLVTLQMRGRMLLHRAHGELWFLRRGAGRYDLSLPPVRDPRRERFEYGFDLLARLNGDDGGRIMNTDPALPARVGLPEDRFVAVEDRPDYLYHAGDLAQFDGPAYRMRRKDVNRFLKNFPDAATEPFSPANLGGARALVPLLFPATPPEADGAPSPFRFDLPTPAQTRYWDRYATRRLLHATAALRLHGVALRVYDRVAGFAFAAVRGEHLLVLVGKILDGLDGGLTLLLQRLVETAPAGIRLVNLADDAGHHGLRRMKENLRPAFLAPRVSLRRPGKTAP